MGYEVKYNETIPHFRGITIGKEKMFYNNLNNRKKHLLFILLLFLLMILTRYPSFMHPLMDIDEGSYAAVASKMLDGGEPYKDGVENKTPIIFYIYYFIFYIFGNYNMLAIHLFTAFVVFFTGIAFFFLMRLFTKNIFISWLPALSFMLINSWYYPKMLAANTEIFTVLPSVLSCTSLYEIKIHLL